MPVPLLLAALLAGEPSIKARTVQASETDIIPIQAQLGFETEIDFPASEVILTGKDHKVPIGDSVFFDATATNNVLHIRPLDVPEVGGGKATNVNVSTITGKHYSFLVREVSHQKGAHADLKVILENGEANDNSNPLDKINEQLAELSKRIDLMAGSKPEAKPVPARDYRYELYGHKGKENFNPAIYRDDKFTYVEISTQELPSIWETKDGKPSKIEATYIDGRYEIPKLIDAGELKVGKSLIKFRWRGES